MVEDNKTEFNSNLATLMRIDDALKLARLSMINDNYEMWFKALRTLKNESIVKMNEEKQLECKVKFLKLEKDLAILTNSGIKINSFNTKIDNDLDDFEVYLRTFMNKKGMLLRDNDPDLSGI